MLVGVQADSHICLTLLAMLAMQEADREHCRHCCVPMQPDPLHTRSINLNSDLDIRHFHMGNWQRVSVRTQPLHLVNACRAQPRARPYPTEDSEGSLLPLSLRGSVTRLHLVQQVGQVCRGLFTRVRRVALGLALVLVAVSAVRGFFSVGCPPSSPLPSLSLPCFPSASPCAVRLLVLALPLRTPSNSTIEIGWCNRLEGFVNSR